MKIMDLDLITYLFKDFTDLPYLCRENGKVNILKTKQIRSYFVLLIIQVHGVNY